MLSFAGSAHTHNHDDVIKWKHFPRYWPFVRGIHRSRSFDVFCDLRLNKRLSKQSRGWWFETLSCSLWRHCSDTDPVKDNCDAIWRQISLTSLQWLHNERDGVSNYRRHDCLLKRLFRRRSKKTSKFRVTGICEGNSPVNSPHKGPVTRKMFPFDDVIMNVESCNGMTLNRSKATGQTDVLTNHAWGLMTFTGNFTGITRDSYPWYEFQNCKVKITAACPVS